MNRNIKTTLLLVTILSGIIWLGSGCKKSNTTLLGTWNYTSYVGGFTYVDTTIRYTPTGIGTSASITFNSNNTFNYTQAHHTFTPFTQDSNNSVSGTYYYSNDTLIMYDSRYPNGPINTKVISLGSNALTLLRTDRDSLFAGGPVDYFEVEYYFAR